MQTILHNCCGLDIHKDSIVACILKTLHIGDKEEVDKDIRVFGTFPDDLKKLSNWIESEDCRHVAMESTGIYWYPIYESLENLYNGEIELLVVNARHMRNVPGKKTDIKDSEWIAKLLRAGLLQGSFIPNQETRDLRQLTRYRVNIVRDICSQKNRIEKTLQQAGFKLSTFLSDIFGVSGRNLIRVIITKGQITPSDVEIETKRISAKKKQEIKLAINGQMQMQQRLFLDMQIRHLDELLSHLTTVECAIEDIIKQTSSLFEESIDLLMTIPGIAQTASKAIIAEIGTDMSKFKTAEHFCSWAGLSPGDNVSAGKKKVHALPLGIHISKD